MTKSEKVRKKKLRKRGFLPKKGFWCRRFAEEASQREGVGELNKEHWDVIHFVRDYYAEYQIAPPVLIIARKVFGGEKPNVSVQKLIRLFRACSTSQEDLGTKITLIAGLPAPTGCV